MAENGLPSRTDRNRLRDIIRLTADLVWETDRDHQLTLLSENSQDLLGEHSSALLGRNLFDIWQLTPVKEQTPDLEWRQPFRNVMAIHVSASGDIRHFVLSGLPVFDDTDGSFICVRGIAKDVTETVKSNEERRILEERSSAIIGFASTGIAVADKDGLIVECNEAWLQFFGYRRKDMLCTSFQELTYHEDETLSLKNMGNLFAGKIERYRQEKRYVRYDGSIAWADVSVSSLKSPDGTVTHSIAGLNDITDRKLAEFALQTSRQKLSEQRMLLQTTLDTIDQGFAVWDPNDCLVAWNKTVAEMWYQPDDLAVGLPRRILFNELIGNKIFAEGSDPHEADQFFDSSLGASKSFDTEYENRDGRKIHVRRYLLPDSGYASVYTDFTDRLAAEKAVRESEEKFRTIAEASGAAIFIVSTNGDEFLYCNNAGADMFAFKAEDLLESSPDKMFADPEISIEMGKSIGRQQKVKNFECMLVRRNGSIFWGMISAETVQFEANDTVLFVVTDIAHLKEVESELRAAKDEADRANQVKTDFLSSMSHELRTPMNSILGFTQLMAEDPRTELSVEQDESLRYIMKAGRHLLNLINDVLDFSNIEASKIEVADEPVSVAELCRDSMLAIESSADERRISTAQDVSDDLVIVGDPTRLKQVLLNLLSNAVKYNVIGGRIILSASATEDDHVRISVADTGKGIPQSKREGLFQAFNRLGAENTEIEGTGIGLSICARLVEVMGGRMGYESNEGKGSTFWIEIKTDTSGKAVSTTATKEPVISNSAADLSGIKG
ncbi:MAG: PAS domain S-box protein [Alphaproteobacteria bacterium]|jgi:PAS domain S-box-containing protein|nr:PAS domain S-box protein [Alphaproteobacteria bacterium]MBT5161418.1 PAS domain S-box protein [Alphaproteobacteria bacterium]MBT7743918.1 PAS domain S-box protein [Alphaproteobacteria bacterium]